MTNRHTVHEFRAEGAPYLSALQRREAAQASRVPKRVLPPPTTPAERYFVGTRVMTPEESQLSLGRSHALLDDTRGVPCGVHNARRWAPCWGSERSGVEGYCLSRVERGKRDANRKGHLLPQPSVHAITITELPVPARRVR